MLNEHIWSRLENAQTQTAGLVVLRLHPESGFNLFVALDPSTGHRFLLLKSSHHEIMPVRPLPSGRGFRVRHMFTAADPEGTHCLEFELTDPNHSDVFDVIGNDVLKSVLESPSDKSAFSAFVARIVEWQTFLDQLPIGGLSKEAQQGLFAELWFLREFVLRESEPEKAVRTWTGPKGLTKDFQFPGISVEVKATSSKQHSRFQISSELQLDEQGIRRLVLFCLLLEILSEGGMSVRELVAALRTELKTHPVALLDFSESLVRSGYVDDTDDCLATRFSIRSLHLFDVRNGFPRIVESDLRLGVGDVQYSVLLSECGHYALLEGEVRGMIRVALS